MEGEKMNFSFLSKEEEQKVQQFFLSKYLVPLSFWNGKKLFRRVHSVWVASEKCAELLPKVKADSAGLMLLLELETLKPSRQGLAFLENPRMKN